MKTKTKAKAKEKPARKPTASLPDGIPQPLTLEQFAKRLDYSPKWVRVLYRRGDLPRPDMHIRRRPYWTEAAYMPVLTGQWKPTTPQPLDLDTADDDDEIE